MPRPKQQQKHPALMMKRLGEESRARIATLKDVDLWQYLDYEQRRFLSHYLIQRDAKAASKASGLSLTWMDEQEEANPAFLEIVQNILDHPKDMAQQLAEEASPLAVLKAIDLMENSRSEKTQLEAAKHIHNVAGLGVPEGGVQNNQLINFNLGTVKKFWNDLKPTNGHVVDEQGESVDDSRG
jgi:hypothetical protein